MFVCMFVCMYVCICENMVGVNMVGVNMFFRRFIRECVEDVECKFI